MLNNTNNAAATKPCQNCGTHIPTGIIACAPCQREWRLQFFKERHWLLATAKKAA